jgi:hypothetical protein
MTTTPGRSLPSRSSSDAPPPVEILHRAHRVAAADDRVRVRPRYRLRHRLRPRSEPGPLEDAHRPVPEDGARVGDPQGEALARLRADVEPEPAGRGLLDAGDGRLRVRPERLRGDDVEREQHLGGAGDGDARAELLRHLAAHEDRLRPCGERLEDADLVLHLRAPEHGDERPRGILEQRAELLQLPQHEQARVSGQEARNALRRGVRPVSRAERVIDVEVAVGRELAGVLGVVRLLARVEARVLEQAQPLVGQELGEPRPHRLHGERGIRALRPPEVRHEHDLLRPALEQELERGQCRADTCVVGDAPVLERDVEVHADEDALAGDVGVPNRARAVERRHRQRSRCTRSTSRQL